MRLLLRCGMAWLVAGASVPASAAFILPDGLSHAPSVVLNCAQGSAIAAPCGTTTTPLIVTPSPAGANSANQQVQITAEQGSSAALGSQSDGAHAGGNGGIVGLLKGIWAELGGGVVAVPTMGGLTSRSISVPAGQSTLLFPANSRRHYLSFQAPQATAIWINPMGGTAAPNAPDCAYFGSGTLYESGNFVNTGVVTIYSPVAVTISAWEG